MTHEQRTPQQGQQYFQELLLREHHARMESQLRNFDFSDPQASEQYPGESAIFETAARNYYGRK